MYTQFTTFRQKVSMAAIKKQKVKHTKIEIWPSSPVTALSYLVKCDLIII